MKRVIWATGLLCVLGAVLLLLVPVLIDLEPLKARWLPVAERALGRPLTVGHVRLSLLPPVGVTVQGIAIMDDPGTGAAPILSIDAVTVRPALLPLLHRDIEIASLTVTHPVLSLIKRADGRWNYQNEPAQTPDRASTAAPADSSANAAMALPVLGALRLVDGSVTIRDPRAGAAQGADRINLSIDRFRLGETVGVKASARVTGWTAPIALSGRVRMAAAAAPDPANLIDEADVLVTIGKSDLRLTARPDRNTSADGGAGPGWTVHLESNRLDLDELLAQQAPPAAPLAVAAGAASAGRAVSRPTTVEATPWPGRVRADATVKTLSVHRLTINNLHAAGEMREGTARLDTLTGQLAGGTVEARGTVNLAQSVRPFDVDATASRIALDVIQRAWSATEPKIAGTATGSTTLRGALGQDDNWQQMVKTIEGRGQLEVRDGSLRGIDLVGTITRELNKLTGKTAENAARRDQTLFSSATATVTLRQGTASIGAIQVESADFSLTASGRVGLTPPQPLDLKAEMRLSEPISRTLPGKSAISLLSERGRLAIPVLIQGTVAEPLILPDAKLLAKRTGRRLSERVLNEVMSDQVDQLQQTGESLLKGLLGR